MGFPSASEVADKYAEYLPLFNEGTFKKREYDLAQEAVEKLRPEADELIADIWADVFYHFRKEEASSMRRKARRYGVMYKNVKGEEEE
jgi:hypothetical protein